MVSALKLPILTLAVFGLTPPAAPPAPAPMPVAAYLRDRMGFDADDLEDLRAGRAVAHQMRARDGVAVNIFGAVRIAAPPAAFVDRLMEIDVLERALGIHEAGRFHDPAQLADLSTLMLDRDDADAIQECQPNDCGLQLSNGAMSQLKRQVNWQAGDAVDQATRAFRQFALDELQTYRAGGLPALGVYQDHAPPTPRAAEFRLLFAPGDLPVELPGLQHYLRAYPGAPLPRASEVFYWNHGDFGMKPTFRLNHLTIMRFGDDRPSPVRAVAATSQIYANHYFSATLELRALVDDPERPGAGFYLLYTTKSRATGLIGLHGFMLRPIVKSKARSGMERYLEATKKLLEKS